VAPAWAASSWGAALASLVLASACAEPPERDPAQWPLARTELERAIPTDDPGEALYRQHCLACHGVDGRGAGGVTGANFTAPDGPLRRPDSELLVSVLEGRRGSVGVMPAQRALLGERGAATVLAYVRRRLGGDASVEAHAPDQNLAPDQNRAPAQNRSAALTRQGSSEPRSPGSAHGRAPTQPMQSTLAWLGAS